MKKLNINEQNVIDTNLIVPSYFYNNDDKFILSVFSFVYHMICITCLAISFWFSKYFC